MAFRDLRRQIEEDFADTRVLAGFDDVLAAEQWCAERRAYRREKRREEARERRFLMKVLDDMLRKRRPKNVPVSPPENLPPMPPTACRPSPRSPQKTSCQTCGRKMPSSTAARLCCPDGVSLGSTRGVRRSRRSVLAGRFARGRPDGVVEIAYRRPKSAAAIGK